MVFQIFLIHLIKEILHKRNARAGKVHTLQHKNGQKKIKSITNQRKKAY